MALDRDVQRLALRLLRALDTPRALSVFILIENEEWDQLTFLKVDPSHYEPHFFCGVEKYRRDCLASEFLRKADFLPTSFDTAQVARESFLITERQCSDTNVRLDRFLENPVLDTDLQVAAYNAIQKAKHWIANTLGSLPSQLNGRFGPGATFESAQWAHRRTMVAYDKLRNPPTRTSGMSEALVDHLVWDTILSESWGACCPNRLIPTSRGSRFATVPKDSTKDRGIAIEPGVNVWGQLAVGQAMRMRLNRRGIDLKHGQDLHRRMAEDASLTGSFSTIDLSNASNTVCRNLVKLLLPDEWYQLLSELRSPFMKFSPSGKKKDGKWIRLEMFSSMGNGYTFELETLIFAALIHSMGGKIGVDSFVYGDDIIVPTEITADVMAVLRYFGFTPNPKKTFTQGNFRESCGGDFLLGHDVRPFYIEEIPHGPSDWIVIANNLWYWSIKWSMPELVAVRNSCLDHLPSDIRKCRGPRELGDLVIHDHPSGWSCVVRSSKRYFRVWRPILKKVYLRALKGSMVRVSSPVRVCRAFTLSEVGVALAAAVLGLPSDGLAPRNGVKGYRFGRVAFS